MWLMAGGRTTSVVSSHIKLQALLGVLVGSEETEENRGV
jgi:hypothetical protein